MSHRAQSRTHVRPSRIHFDEHPSPFAAFPSSHSSPGSVVLFPHVRAQVEGAPGEAEKHANPGMIVQRGEHPSPPVVFLSSHCSVPMTTPSPQLGLHTGVRFMSQFHPVSMRQRTLQPSPPRGGFWCSSHSSEPVLMPSPQNTLHELGKPEQIHPVSGWQRAEHPSWGLLLPSSHSSPLSIALLPHTEAMAPQNDPVDLPCAHREATTTTNRSPMTRKAERWSLQNGMDTFCALYHEWNLPK